MLKTLNLIAMTPVIFVGLLASSLMAAEKVVVVPLFSQSNIDTSLVKTGQTSTVPVVAVTGSDGDLQKGVDLPSPRFTDNSDGTVTDNLTRLIWLANANCTDTAGGTIKNSDQGRLSWSDANTRSNNLADGICGLTDSSVAGDWRLPNIIELESLRDFRYFDPALPNDAGTGKWVEGATSSFSNVDDASGDRYWSSTTAASNTSEAFYVNYYYPVRSVRGKASNLKVWSIRD